MPRYNPEKNPENNSLKFKVELDNLQETDDKDITGYLNYNKNTETINFNAEVGRGKEYDNNTTFDEYAIGLEYYVPNSDFYFGLQDMNTDSNNYWEINFGKYFNNNSYFEISRTNTPIIDDIFESADSFYNIFYGTFYTFTNGCILNVEVGPQFVDDDINIRCYLNLRHPELLDKIDSSIDLQFFINLDGGIDIPTDNIYTTLRAEYLIKDFE